MTSTEKLSIALILALSSNAVLLVLLLLKTAGVSFTDHKVCDVQRQNVHTGGVRRENFQRSSYKEQLEKGSKTADWDRIGTLSGTLSEECLDFLKRAQRIDFLSKAEGSLYDKLLVNYCSQNFFKVGRKPIFSTYRSSRKEQYVHRPARRTLNYSPLSDAGRRDSKRFQDYKIKSPTQKGFLRSLLDHRDSDFGKTLHSKTGSDVTVSSRENKSTIALSSNQQQDSTGSLRNGSESLGSVRSRRAVYTDPTGQVSATHRDPIYKLTEVFSTFTDEEIEQFESPVSDLLIPSLMHFEGMVIREIEDIQDHIIAHDLRLEQLEKVMLNMVENEKMEPQSDSVDNKSELDNLKHVLGENEGFLAVGNDSLIIETLNEDGSGDGEGIPTTTTTKKPPTTEDIAIYDLYRDLSAVEQKVMALENYNVMSDSELRRIRNEVVKMDDKVTELDRKYRNVQVRTSMQGYKITELETYMSRSELTLHNSVDLYSRLNARLESFKDRLTEFSSDLHGVTVEFGRQDQIANELRAADAYKAHDISEMRKSMLGLEGRVNGLYLVLDQNVDTVRNDIRTMLDRLCFSNNLSC